MVFIVAPPRSLSTDEELQVENTMSVTDVNRPGSLPLSDGCPTASGALARGPRRITKKESYSSLSEYSSRSSSIDLLIAAAISTPLDAQGAVERDGEMVTFVADGINELIKRSRGE